jgi:integrase
MRNRKQEGQIVVINDRWYVRFYERQNVNGVVERKRVTHCLGPVESRGKHPPADIKTAAEDHMRTVNNSSIPAERNLTFSSFVEDVYLPWVKEHKRASTYKGYTDIWRVHLKPITNRERGNLKAIRTFTIQGWLNQLAKGDLSRNSLKHIKSTISGIFTLAKQLGYFDGSNPAQGSAIDPRAPEPGETYAYDLEEIQKILSVLPAPSDTAFAVAAFAGLRHGELQGLDWGDYHDGQLWVARSVWNGIVNDPKTRKSKAPVPVIRQLAERLDMHRLRSADPKTGLSKTGPIFANSVGGRLNLNNLLGRTMLPALNRCVHCGTTEGKPHIKHDHKYERDTRIPEWRGWHACRRGLASNLNRLGVDDSVIQRMLRHSNINVTQTYYIKTAADDVRSAMGKFEDNLAAQTAAQVLRDSDRTVKVGSGAMPESVN